MCLCASCDFVVLVFCVCCVSGAIVVAVAVLVWVACCACVAVVLRVSVC